VAGVRRRLTAAPADHTLRPEPLLRSAFSWLMTPAELADRLGGRADWARQPAASQGAGR